MNSIRFCIIVVVGDRPFLEMSVILPYMH